MPLHHRIKPVYSRKFLIGFLYWRSLRYSPSVERFMCGFLAKKLSKLFSRKKKKLSWNCWFGHNTNTYAEIFSSKFGEKKCLGSNWLSQNMCLHSANKR
jgi:hypothetical protein